MTARLPIPGGDDGTWGDILNEYLEVSHTASGILNPGVVGTDQLQNNCVTNAQLDVPTQTAIDAVTSKYVKPAGGIPSTDLSTAVQTDLTAASTAIQSVNSKTGTAVTLKVADLNDASAASSATNNQVLSYNSGTSQWVPATVSSTTVGDATTSSKGIVELAGDLSGTAISPTVAKINGVSISGVPSNGQVITASSGSAASWSTLSASSIGAAQVLTPTAVKTSAYTANPGDFIPVDASGGNVTITLPTTPADKTRVEIKLINTVVNTTNGYGNNIVTFSTGGSDVFNKASGSTTGSLAILNQAVMLQYVASSGIWYVQSDDLPLASMVSGIAHTITTTYSIVSTDHVIMADATSAGFTITLPTAVGFTGRYSLIAITTNGNLITITTTGSQTIDGASSTTLGNLGSGAQWSAVDLVSDGANWRTI